MSIDFEMDILIYYKMDKNPQTTQKGTECEYCGKFQQKMKRHLANSCKVKKLLGIPYRRINCLLENEYLIQGPRQAEFPHINNEIKKIEEDILAEKLLICELSNTRIWNPKNLVFVTRKIKKEALQITNEVSFTIEYHRKKRIKKCFDELFTLFKD